MTSDELLANLNDSQRAAVTTTEGFVRVIAGAGSGKTRALAHRFAYLVNAIGVLPANILCVTFTNKAAAEMKARIRKLCAGNDAGYIATFHSFCVSVLQEDSYAVGYPKSFFVLDNGDIDAMLRIIYEERGLTLRDKTFGDARDMFEMRKTKYQRDYYQDMIALPIETLKEKYDAATKTDDILFYGYLYQQKKTFALDYNDLIVFVLHIFETNEAVRQKWQSRLEYIMVDEFQDIDEIQHRLMEALCAYHKNLFVVGDSDQTIYTWRGANIKYLLDFDKKFGTEENPCTTIMMNENFRSTQPILDAANSLISKNKNRIEKNLFAAKEMLGCRNKFGMTYDQFQHDKSKKITEQTSHPELVSGSNKLSTTETGRGAQQTTEIVEKTTTGNTPAPRAPLPASASASVFPATATASEAPAPVYHHTKKQTDEATWICEQIEALHKAGAKYSDCAVLYRAHYVSRNLEEIFAQKKIPFTLYSGVQFFDREEVKDALNYLRLCVLHDDLSFRRVVNKPKRNIGKSRMEAIEQYALEHGMSNVTPELSLRAKRGNQGDLRSVQHDNTTETHGSSATLNSPLSTLNTSMSLYEALCKMNDEGAEILSGTGAKKFIELIEKFSSRAAELPASELLSSIINESGYEKMLRTEGSQTRLDNLAELKQAIHEFEISCGEDCDAQYFLKRTALLTGLDAGSGQDAVKFMTVHTAKGLEFPHVFLCAINEGIFPSQKTKTPEAMEEERRLCFVAITRAQKTLHISDSEGRNLDGSIRYPSRFIFDIDKKYLEYTAPLAEAFTAQAKTAIANFDHLIESRAQTSALKAGDEVTHAILGHGTILEVAQSDGAFLIKFDTLSTPRKIRAGAIKAAK